MKALVIALFICTVILVASKSSSSRELGSRIKRSAAAVNQDGSKGKKDRRTVAWRKIEIWQTVLQERTREHHSSKTERMLAEVDGSSKQIKEGGLLARLQGIYETPLYTLWDIIMGQYGNVKNFWFQLESGNFLTENDNAGVFKFNHKYKLPDRPAPPIKKGVCPFYKLRCRNQDKEFRTFDGSCNNLSPGNQQWGSVNRAQDRMLRPDYADGVSEPRKAYDGSELPSARAVSLGAFDNVTHPSNVNTLMLMSFGQFLDHDITHTPVTTAFFDEKTKENVAIDCGTDNCGVSGDAGRDCFPIITPPNDPIFGSQKTCMGFVRSEAVLKDDCSYGERSQANTVTSWLDLSQVYGSNIDDANRLRDTSLPARGRMHMNEHPIDKSLKPLLPYHEDSTSACTGLDSTVRCFKAGDIRQNEQVGLTSLHTLYVRMHNIIEDNIHKEVVRQNRKWSGEKLYQVTRKVFGGQWQHIVYNEYLPIVVGPKLLKKYGLETLYSGYYNGYDRYTRGDILTCFSTAAFRYGHSQIPKHMMYADYSYNKHPAKQLTEILFNPKTIYRCPFAKSQSVSPIDAIIHGMASAEAETVDNHFTAQIMNHLFTADVPNGPGLDLAAMNIQRGRDHGLKGYVYWREVCGLSRPRSFGDLVNIPGVANIKQKLQILYKEVEDIDLYVAAISESPVVGGVVGPTFACIIAKQFKKLKDGDRFYYENKHVHGFSLDQLNEIRKFTLSQLLCDTLDRVDSIQPYVLLQHNKEFNGEANARKKCADIPAIDYSVFV